MCGCIATRRKSLGKDLLERSWIATEDRSHGRLLGVVVRGCVHAVVALAVGVAQRRGGEVLSVQFEAP